MASNVVPKRSRLDESSYHSPYSLSGAPTPHPNVDSYAPLRAKALATLEAMGYDPTTMVERGVVWAEDQDPFNHVMHSQYMHFFGTAFHRVMESYDQWLNEEEYKNMFQGKGVIPVISSYKMDIKRPVKYPDSLIAAYREIRVEPKRNFAVTSLFSLKQQCIVAEVEGAATYLDTTTGRSVDIRTVGGGWVKVFDGLTQKAEEAQRLKEKWDAEHAKPKAKA